MDIEARLVLLTTLGQLRQLRVWNPSIDPNQISSDDVIEVIRYGNNFIINVPDLEVDLYGKLSALVALLEHHKMLSEVEFEADLESYENGEDFSVLLTPDGDVTLLTTNLVNKKKSQDWVKVEWIKRIVALEDNTI